MTPLAPSTLLLVDQPFHLLRGMAEVAPLAQEREGIGQWLFLVIFVLIWVFSIVAGAIKKQQQRRQQQERFSRGPRLEPQAAENDADAEEELPKWVHDLPEPVRRQMGIEVPPAQRHPPAGAPAPARAHRPAAAPDARRASAEPDRPRQEVQRPRFADVERPRFAHVERPRFAEAERPDIFQRPHRQPYARRETEPYQRREPTLPRTSGAHDQKRPLPPRAVTSRQAPTAAQKLAAAGTTPDIHSTEIGRGDTPASPAAREADYQRSRRLRGALRDRKRFMEGVLISEILRPPVSLREQTEQQ